MSPPRVLGRAEWQYYRHPGSDRATLSSTDHGFHLSGRANLRFPEGLTAITYAISCDSRWRPRAARVDLRRGRHAHFLRIEIEDGSWTIDGFHHRELEGFTDVDLSVSPSTNTLALRRLDLPVGGAGEFDVGWIVFPDLEVRAVRQRYTRLAPFHYRYEGLHYGFVAEFGVDDLGLVTEYPEFWTRLPLSRLPGARSRRSPRRRA